MIGEIIAIGDELTSGRILNTTTALAARELFLLGHEVRAMFTVGDDLEEIGKVLKTALKRSDFLIVTGGLGATSDDLTNEAVARALELPIVPNARMQAVFEANRRATPEGKLSMERMACMPKGAEPLDAACRMAGYRLLWQNKLLYFLPGVPPQMEILLHDKVIPGLQDLDGGRALPVAQRVYRTCGLYEIEINNRLRPLEEAGRLQVGYYPIGAEVHVSLTGLRLAGGLQDPVFAEADGFIRTQLGDSLYGTDATTLAAAAGELLMAKNMMLATAESCTGGLIGARLTETPGSSRWFRGGAIVYSNALKEAILGVDHALLATFGAVSDEVARAMALGTVTHLGSDIAVAVTGIAGPDGGSEEKPVGTVYIGLAQRGDVTVRRCAFRGDRHQIQEKTAQTAMDMVRRAVLAR